MRRPAAARLVFDGQSRLAIPNWTGFLGYSWGRLITAQRPENVAGYLVAVSGEGWQELTASFHTRCKPKITTVEPTIFVMCGGGSDILDDPGVSGATVYSRAGSYAALARSAGAAWILSTTIMPGLLFTTDASGTAEARRQAANDLILADASNYFDDTVDLDVGPLLDTIVGDYYYDGTHVYGPGAIPAYGAGLGTQYVADLVKPHIDTAIAAVT
jgi:hypothetical protein